MNRSRIGAIVAALTCFAALPASAEFLPSPPGQVVDLPTRPGVTLRYAAYVPDRQPRAIVILFVGGQGVLNIPDKPGPNWQNPGNFLSRSRENFRRRDLFVAVPDAPSDHKSGLGGWRMSADHAEDIAHVIADLRRRVPSKPVWIIGTSAGTPSVANIAARLGGRGPDGVVFTSSTTQPPGAGSSGNETVFDADLAAIRIPALVVAHRNDGCYITPAYDAPKLRGRLVNSPKTELLLFDGGDRPRSSPCEAYSQHGFIGIEDRVIGAIADWILTAKS